MAESVQDAIERAANFGSKAETLVFVKGQCPTGDRITPLMGYWSLVFEVHKAILSLLASKYYGAAFALVRPIVEATVRAHLMVRGPDEVVKEILDDRYRTNFKTVGKEIDAAFGLEEYFDKFLTDAKEALHGYTHIGMHQLGRRFTGNDLLPNYTDGEILEVIRTSTSALFMVNNIVTKHLGWEDGWQQNTDMYVDWGKQPQTTRTSRLTR